MKMTTELDFKNDTRNTQNERLLTSCVTGRGELLFVRDRREAGCGGVASWLRGVEASRFRGSS